MADATQFRTDVSRAGSGYRLIAMAEKSRKGTQQETASAADSNVVPIELGRTPPARQADRRPSCAFKFWERCVLWVDGPGSSAPQS